MMSSSERATEELVEALRRIKLELQGTTAQGGDAECLLDSLLDELRRITDMLERDSRAAYLDRPE